MIRGIIRSIDGSMNIRSMNIRSTDESNDIKSNDIRRMDIGSMNIGNIDIMLELLLEAEALIELLETPIN
mgnify:CR=1 FL=1